MKDTDDLDVDLDDEFEDEDVDLDADDEFEEALDGRFEGFKRRGRQAVSDAAEQGRRQMYFAAGRGKQRLADALDLTANRLDGRITRSSEYLRTRDVEVMRDDLIEAVRRRPLLSAGIALGAGYLVAKAMGIGSGKGGKRRGSSALKRKLARAVVSSLAAAAASRLKAGLIGSDEEEEYEAPPRPRKKAAGRPRSRTR